MVCLVIYLINLPRFYCDLRLVANGFHLCQKIGSMHVQSFSYFVFYPHVLIVHGVEEIEVVALHKSLSLTDLKETLS